ncbi:MAG: hypothetical protein ACI8W1_003221 [Candidatus Azotimanducaceae bacterium]|jgi:hypothetical protein
MALESVGTKVNSRIESKPQTSDPVKASETQRPQLTPSREENQRAFNVTILQANHDASLSAKNEPQALLYKTVIDSINKELEADQGTNAIEKGYESGVDVTPAATAGRIVALSTRFFSQFQEQHPKLNEQDQVDRFLNIISNGIDQGFGAARETLDGLGVLEGDISDNIDRTYELVQEGLASFRDLFNFSPKD